MTRSVNSWRRLPSIHATCCNSFKTLKNAFLREEGVTIYRDGRSPRNCGASFNKKDILLSPPVTMWQPPPRGSQERDGGSFNEIHLWWMKSLRDEILQARWNLPMAGLGWSYDCPLDKFWYENAFLREEGGTIYRDGRSPRNCIASFN